VKKLIIILSFLSLILFSCKEKDEEEKGVFTINGNFKNSNGEIVVLYQRTPFEFIPLDSVKIETNGDFILKSKSQQKDFYVLNAGTDYDVILLIDTAQKVEITADLLNLANSYIVKGSPESEKIQKIENKLAATKVVIDSLSKIYDKYFGLPGFDTIKNQLDSVFYPVLSDQKSFSRKFVSENLSSLVSLIAISQFLTPKAPVFDKEEDADIYFLVDSALTAKFPESPHVKKLNGIVATMKNNLADNLTPSGNVTVGSKAPDFSLPNQFGDSVRLSTFEGKYVLLHFWASWSINCLPVNDILKKNFWAFFPKIQIIQISLDQDFTKWKEFVKKEELSWYQCCDLKVWESSVVKSYGIKSLPTNFLIDPKGKIIAVDLLDNNMEIKLKEVLKK